MFSAHFVSCIAQAQKVVIHKLPRAGHVPSKSWGSRPGFLVWLFIGSYRLLQGRLGLCDSQGHGAAAEAASEANAIYERLVHLDPMRSGFYKDALAGKAFVVVSALGRN